MQLPLIRIPASKIAVFAQGNFAHNGVDHVKQVVNCASDYTIHFCSSSNISTSISSVSKMASEACILHLPISSEVNGLKNCNIQHHKDSDGSGHSTLLVFSGGYPNGGEPYTDVHGVPWSCIPAGGATIVKNPWTRVPFSKIIILVAHTMQI